MHITKIPGLVAESALSVAGVRVGTEEPYFIRRPLTDAVEIRQYGPRIAAETTVADDEDRSRNIGFRRLARYIFGANHRDETISMTAPVSQQPNRDGDEIAMTAPVAQSRNSGGHWTIRFFMPSKWSIETLPKPDDDNVRLVTVPAETVAVLRFTGDRSPDRRAGQNVAGQRHRARRAIHRVVLRPAVDIAVPTSQRDRHPSGHSRLE